MSAIRLVSAGTGKSVEIPDTISVADLRALAELSDDVKLAFNGEPVVNEHDVMLEDGDTVIASPSKVSHG